MMSRYLIHTACPDARRQVANGLEGLSGQPGEHSVPLRSIGSTTAKEWDDQKQYNGLWWGASQALTPEIAMALLIDGLVKKSESFYAAFDEKSGTLLDHNCPVPPADATFPAFLTECGLEYAAAGEPKIVVAFPK